MKHWKLFPCFYHGYLCPVLFCVPKLNWYRKEDIGAYIDNLIIEKLERENNSFISLVIPTRILGDNNLTSLEMLLLIIIISLCKKKGFCWATNEYFKKILKVSKQTISKSIGSLSRNNYINLEYELHEKNNSKRKIRISEVLKNEISDIQENINTSIKKTLINIIDIIIRKKIYLLISFVLMKMAMNIGMIKKSKKNH